MKTFFLAFFSLKLFFGPAFAQTDTVEVSPTAATYLVFPENVDLVDIGLADQYSIKIEDQVVFVKAKQGNSIPTTLLVKHADNYFTGFLRCVSKPKKTLYDFRRDNSQRSHSSPSSSHPERKVNLEQVKQHLAKFGALRQDKKGKRISVVKNNIRLSLTHLRNDQQATYLRLEVTNRSAMDYQVDWVSFELLEKRGKRFSRNNTNRQEIEPLLSSGPQKMGAHQSGALLFALPLYAPGSRGKLTITLRETEGSRALQLKIPARYITQAKML